MSKSKKRKTQQAQHDRPSFPPFPMAISVPPDLARAMGLLDNAPPTFPELVRRAEHDGKSSFVRGIALDGRHTMPDGIAGDGVLVCVPSPEGVAAFQALGGSASLRPISITAVEGRPRSGIAISLLDVEDARRLVNAIQEAIAHVEAREGVR